MDTSTISHAYDITYSTSDEICKIQDRRYKTEEAQSEALRNEPDAREVVTHMQDTRCNM